MQTYPIRAKCLWTTSSMWAQKIHGLAEAMEESTPIDLRTSIDVSVENFARILHKCGRERDVVQASCLHAYMREIGLDTDASLGNYLVSMLVEVGRMDDAQQVFDKLPYRNSWAWNPLITGHVNHGKPQEAVLLYHKMEKDDFLHLNGHTFVALLKACAMLKDRRTGLQLHADIIGLGLLERNLFIGSSVIDMYAKCGTLAKAEQVFNQVPLRDVVSWTTLITGFVEHGRHEDALWFFEQMQLEGVSPNAATFISCLRACCSIGDAVKGQEIHAEIERQCLLEGETFIGSTLVDMYAKLGSLSVAHDLFNRLPSRDVVSWTSLIAGYADHRYGREALQCLEQMQSDGVPPNAATLVCVLKACGSIRAREKGEEIQAEAERQGLLESNVLVGGAVVDMYAKCGLPVKAQKVFDKLPSRDVVTWTALIAGYADHGHSDKAIECFAKMRSEGITPNSATMACVLKSCSSTRDLEKCKEVLSAIERQGLLEREPVLGGTMIDMYVKCGMLDVARKVFDKLPARDVVSWTALIAGYADHGRDVEALTYFEEMGIEGIFPNVVTFLCSVKACSSRRTFHKGQQLHADIERRGLLVKDLAIGNTLISMYTKLGSLALAHELFYQLPTQDIVSWTALITGYSEHGYGVEALTCYEKMRSEGITPNAVTYACILKACGGFGAMEKGREIHDEIERHGLVDGDFVIGNTLVDLYGKSGSLGRAHEVFESLRIQNEMSWNALIAGYSQYRKGDEALKCLQQMLCEGVFPIVNTWICALRACGAVGARGKGKEVHLQMLERGILESDNVFMESCLIDMYGKCGSLDLAQRVFDQVVFKDVGVWTALIGVYAGSSCSEEALRLFVQMQAEGVPPNALTLACCLKTSCALRAIEKGQKLHVLIQEEHFADPYVCSSLVDMYSKCGSLAIAKEVLNSLPNKDVVSWTSLISGYAEHGCGHMALECFHQMEHEGVVPNTVTLLCGLKACCDVGAAHRGIRIHADIERRGLLESDLIGNTLVNMYAKCGAIACARQVFGCLRIRDVVSWNTLLTGYAGIGDIKGVFNIFKDMQRQCVKPDAVTFVVVLGACSHMGLSERSETYFESMSRAYGIAQGLEHHTCLIDLLGRAGKLERALAMIKMVPFCLDHVVWHSFLTACKYWGNVELGKQAFNSMVSLDRVEPAGCKLERVNIQNEEDNWEVIEACVVG